MSGDILRGGGNTSGVPSISSSQKKTQKNPTDVQAWRDLSTALQTDGRTDEAITAQQRVVALTPKDTDALRELAGLYLTQSAAKQQAAQAIQLRPPTPAAWARASPACSPPRPTGQSVLDDKISSVINTQSSTEIQRLVNDAQNEYGNAIEAYKKIAKLQPTDPNVQLELAQTAQQAGDTCERQSPHTRSSSKLAPDDPNADIVKAQLKQLQKQTRDHVGLDSPERAPDSATTTSSAGRRPGCRRSRSAAGGWLWVGRALRGDG